MRAPGNTIRIGETAKRLSQCFGVNVPLPKPIPVWVADVNCEREAFAAELLQLRSASGQAGYYDADYADLSNGQHVTSLSIFLRGQGYRSPDTMVFEDSFGTLRQPGQIGPFPDGTF